MKREQENRLVMKWKKLCESKGLELSNKIYDVLGDSFFPSVERNTTKKTSISLLNDLFHGFPVSWWSSSGESLFSKCYTHAKEKEGSKGVKRMEKEEQPMTHEVVLRKRNRRCFFPFVFTVQWSIKRMRGIENLYPESLSCFGCTIC